MGLIKAGMGALGGTLADQWKEFFYCDSLDKDVLMVKGQKRTSRRSSNNGEDNIITNGSGIAVADGQCMLIVEQGRVVEVCAEPGEFTFDASTEPSVFTGNFGDSWKWNVPATQKFTEVIGLSVIMGGISFVLSIVIAVPLGVLAATKQYSRTDYVITAAALVGISLPTFFFATLLKLLFSVKLGWFDLYGLVGRDYAQLDAWGQFCDKANHLVLPIATLVIVSIGGYMRYTRTNMLEVLNADYIRTARAKGLSEHTVIYKHAFRNTLIPLVTIIGGSLPGLFSGALITETLFSIPGIGYISYQSMVAGDIPFTMFYLSFMAVLTLASNLLTDILYGVVDPRVRIS